MIFRHRRPHAPPSKRVEDFHLIRDFALIMAAAGTSVVVVRRLGQPPILGYLVAGLIIGPYNIPSIKLTDLQTIRWLADLGLLVLLFTLGLEFGWQRIRRLGFGVLLIGAIEIATMLAVGYSVGAWLGWTETESIFLGSALCISSSAVLVKVLRDEGRLRESFAQIIIGILVVEDLAAVILLSLLSAIASSGTADVSGIGLVAARLALFTASALLLGGLLGPRLVSYVARFNSRDTLLVTSLALCFGLALVAHELGISAAAGAFLIGAVLGDSEKADDITESVAPLRDMFAAVFFVSIGMLVDLAVVVQFLVPITLITLVFVMGKISATTAGAFLAGHDERTAMRVGMGMPQAGEFSLAMVKVGVDHQAVGGFLYPVIAAATALTSFIYPWIFRSTESLIRFLERVTPLAARQSLSQLSSALNGLRDSPSSAGGRLTEFGGVVRQLLIHIGLILVIVATGTVLLKFALEISREVGIDQQWVGLAIAGAVVALCLPSTIGLGRGIGKLSDLLYDRTLQKLTATIPDAQARTIQLLFRNVVTVSVFIFLGIWSLPFFSRLFFLSRITAPVPILVLTVVVILAVRAAFSTHSAMESGFKTTFLGEPPEPPTPNGSGSNGAEDPQGSGSGGSAG